MTSTPTSNSVDGERLTLSNQVIPTDEELCLKSPKSLLENVSTTCGSGWVDVEHAKFLLILNSTVDPPATAGGTDSAPTTISDF